MKNLKKLALGALLLAGSAVGLSQPAAAGVHVGIGIGIPGPSYYGPAYACDPYYEEYDDYGCGAYYSGPVFINGVWFNGPMRWRWWGGHRQFWSHGGWHIGTGWRSGGFHGRGFHPGTHSPWRGGHGGFHGPSPVHGAHWGGGGGSHWGGGGSHWGGGGGSHGGGGGHHGGGMGGGSHGGGGHHH